MPVSVLGLDLRYGPECGKLGGNKILIHTKAPCETALRGTAFNAFSYDGVGSRSDFLRTSCGRRHIGTEEGLDIACPVTFDSISGYFNEI